MLDTTQQLNNKNKMSGKMQESGAPEIISLIYTLATWGQDPVFSMLNPLRLHSRVASVAGGLMALTSSVG